MYLQTYETWTAFYLTTERKGIGHNLAFVKKDAPIIDTTWYH